jgi:hypothetical protein
MAAPQTQHADSGAEAATAAAAEFIMTADADPARASVPEAAADPAPVDAPLEQEVPSGAAAMPELGATQLQAALDQKAAVPEPPAPEPEAAQAEPAGEDAPAVTDETGEADAGTGAADAAPPRRGRFGMLLHKKTLIIAGAAIAPVIIGAIAYGFLHRAPGPAHDTASHDPAATREAKGAIEAGAAHEATTGHETAATHPPEGAATPDAAVTASAHAAAEAVTPAPAHAADTQGADQHTATAHPGAPASTLAPAQKPADHQAAELAETQKLLAEERAKRIAAEESLRLAQGPQPAFTQPGKHKGAMIAGAGGATSAATGAKPGGRRLEDCNVQRGSFAETLKACIEEFNRMPQNR